MSCPPKGAPDWPFAAASRISTQVRSSTIKSCRGRYPAALIEYMRGHGRTKVLFGTNYPMIMPAKALEGLNDVGLGEEAKALFLAGNAQRVFKLN